jgi:hypothetical protein
LVTSVKQKLWEKIEDESVAAAIEKMLLLPHFERNVVNLVKCDQPL